MIGLAFHPFAINSIVELLDCDRFGVPSFCH